MGPRTFIPGGLALLLLGCGGGGGSSSAPPRQEYRPSPDSPAFKPRLGYVESKVSSAPREVVSFTDPVTSNSFSARCDNPLRGGIEFSVVDTNTYRWPSMLCHDPSGVYFPEITDVKRIPPSKGNALSSNNPTSFSLVKVLFGSKFGDDLYVLKSPFHPFQFEPSALRRTPNGLAYAGKHSFDDLRRYQGILQQQTGAAVFVFPNAVTAKAHALATTSGQLIEHSNNIIDAINAATNGAIDKKKKYDIYLPTLSYLGSAAQAVPLLVASDVSRDPSSVTINELYPLHPGNEWEYAAKDQSPFTVRTSIGKVFGKEFITVDEGDGARSFLGFQGRTLKYFGFGADGLKVMLDNPITVGDDQMFHGRSFHTSSGVVVEGRPEIEGSVTTQYTVLSRDNTLLTHNKRPFGDCFRIEERTSVSLRNKHTNKSSSQNVVTTRFLAQNVGPVRITSQNSSVDLTSMSHGSRASSLESKVSGTNNAVLVQTTPQAMLRAVRGVK